MSGVLRRALGVLTTAGLVSCQLVGGYEGFEAQDPLALVAISSGDLGSCAIDGSGQLLCWGDQLIGSSLPTLVGERWRTVSVGNRHACAVRQDGTLWCWGRNCAGQIDEGPRDFRAKLVRVGSAADWVAVAAGSGRTCGIASGGKLVCWGGADVGQLDCSETQIQEPFTLGGAWKQVTAGVFAIHALREDGSLWRMLDFSYSSDGSESPFGPFAPLGDSSWNVVSTGHLEGCGVRVDGTMACISFGSDQEEQVGDGDEWGSRIAVRNSWGCAIKGDGTLWCWGSNQDGALGQSFTTGGFFDLRQVGTDADWTEVSGNCGIRMGRAYCWGSNEGGLLGRGTADPAPQPPGPIYW